MKKVPIHKTQYKAKPEPQMSSHAHMAVSLIPLELRL